MNDNPIAFRGTLQHMGKLENRLKKTGIRLMNIMPLIPTGNMKNYQLPSCAELSETRRKCEEIIPQFYKCEQCRADIVHLPTKSNIIA